MMELAPPSTTATQEPLLHTLPVAAQSVVCVAVPVPLHTLVTVALLHVAVKGTHTTFLQLPPVHVWFEPHAPAVYAVPVVLQVPCVPGSMQLVAAGVQMVGWQEPFAESHAAPLPHATSRYLVPDASHTCDRLDVLHLVAPGAQMTVVHAAPLHTSVAAHALLVYPVPVALHVCNVAESPHFFDAGVQMVG